MPQFPALPSTKHTQHKQVSEPFSISLNEPFE
uniref:Uncharacterized protein n=1 Tax=Anguilla anguilla TaxID=7936 RepID=A0A0E9PUZ1_ANGAN